MLKMHDHIIVSQKAFELAKIEVIAFDNRDPNRDDIELTLYVRMNSDDDPKPIAETILTALGFSYLRISNVSGTTVTFDCEKLFSLGKAHEIS